MQKRATQSVWWPGPGYYGKQLYNMLQDAISTNRTSDSSSTTNSSIAKSGSRSLEYKKSSYVIIVDYFSCFIEIAKLTSTSSPAMITQMKSVFARHGIPAV